MTPVCVGFYGKLPSRGDFLRGALPRAVAAGWDSWMEAVLATTRSQLGGSWSGTWASLRPWRFTIDPGLCGRARVSGVWLASTDRVGRPFPFLLASVAGAATDPFLDAAEAVAAAAVAGDLAPDDLAGSIRERLRSKALDETTAPGADGWTRWWRGEQGRSEQSLDVRGWPNAEAFARMVSSS